jgi:hypothetical protein
MIETFGVDGGIDLDVEVGGVEWSRVLGGVGINGGGDER